MPTVKIKVKHAKLEFVPQILDAVYQTHKTQVQKDLVGYFNLITGDWSAKSRPKLTRITYKRDTGVTTVVTPAGPNAKIWTYVTRGTRKHIIKPKRARFLRFMWGGPGSYIPKTKPGGQYGGPGMVQNGKSQFRKSVNHPGSRGRFFERRIVNDYTARYIGLMEKAIQRGLRAAKVAMK